MQRLRMRSQYDAAVRSRVDYLSGYKNYLFFDREETPSFLLSENGNAVDMSKIVVFDLIL